MTEPHVDTALVSYLRGELSADERQRVERHLEACESCRAAAEDFRVIRERLAATPPPVAEPHWGRYRAELRARLEASGRRRRAGWLLRPVPVAMAAAAVAAIVLTLTVGQHGGGPGDAVVDDAVLATRLDMIDKRPIVERLDLLEDLDVIRDLDRLASPREG